MTVDQGGRIEPRGDGRAEVRACIGSVEASTAVLVRNVDRADPIGFTHEVLPALTKAGCNQGACHGTPAGKNGFRLSLRGYNPALDFETLARENGTRRTNPFEPDASLILLKGTGRVPHEGGKRMGTDSISYRVLRDWVAEAVRPDPADIPRLVGLVVTPPARILDAPARTQQLVVRARFADGSTHDVTRLARYSSTDTSIARVDDEGRVVKQRRGEATILVSFEHLVATSRLLFREPVPGLVWADPPASNFIDEHVFAKLKQLRIPPSELSNDAMFCRRVYLDLIGLVPTPEELVGFLEDPRPDKRARLTDALLKRPEYVDFWTLKWADRLGCNQRFTGVKGAISYHRWIRDQIAGNVPFDRFVRAIITAKGPNFTNPPASFYRRVRNPEDAAETVSQVFLGVRLGCARCHNHVAERWTQDDYYGMAAFFSQVRYKNGPQNYAQYNKEETVYLAPDAEIRQPRTGVVMKPRPLGGEPVTVSRGRRPPRRAGRLARLAVQSVLRPGRGQPHLVPPDGPRHRRAGGRHPRVEPPGVGRAPRCAGRRFQPARIRRPADDPPDRQQPRLSALVAAEPLQRRGHAVFLACHGAHAVSRADARLGVSRRRASRRSSSTCPRGHGRRRCRMASSSTRS